MIRRVTAAIAATIYLSTPAAFAQTRTSVTLQPGKGARWDAALHVGWLGVNKGEIAPEWNRWYQVGAIGGSVGYHATPHVKVELDIARGGEGRVYSYLVGPTFARSREDQFRTTTFNGTLSYQFLENTWFHPFVGVGVDAVRESARTRLSDYAIWPSPVPVVLPPPEFSPWEASAKARAMAVAGFKWYVSERAFIRSDLRTSFSNKRTESMVWRAGVGFDF
jgi:hypothetical protein